MKRKKRLKIIQVSLLVATFFIVFFTFSQKNKISEQQIVLKETKKKIENQLNSQKKNEDIFLKISFKIRAEASNATFTSTEPSNLQRN